MFPLDQSLFLFLNHALKSDLNDYWLGYATWLGNGWIGFPLALLALFFLDKTSFWRNVLLLAIAGMLGGIALNLIKQVVHAQRPLTVFASDIVSGKVYVNVLFDKFYYNSFPSGHTQTAFTIATVLIYAGSHTIGWNRWKSSGIVLIASIIGLSRIYCGAHFPSDITAGALVGVGTGWISFVAVDRITKSKLRKRFTKQIAGQPSNVADAT
ncbi:MAG TPA: phosphatase PAP2 family protein [Candidatus Kapabacteria bacterium]